MSTRPFVPLCAAIILALSFGCDNECCSVTPDTKYAHIELYPEKLLFTALQAGPVPAPQKVFLFNSGSSCLGWKADVNEPWLGCAPDSGFTGSCGETDTILVSVDSSGLEKGEHRGRIYISSKDADNDPGEVEVTLSVVSLSDIFVIREAWWTDTVDADSNGCPERGRLTWDADVLDGSTREVSAQVFYREECTDEWKYYHTTSCWTISGDDRDDTYFVTVDNLPAGNYEFSILLYQCGGSEIVAQRGQEDDADLDNRCFESLVTFSIYDAWWAGESDADGDGCRDSGMLAWDADVDDGVTASVQGHVYYREVGASQWTYYRSSACYDISGKDRDDAWYVSVEGLDPGRYEFIIDLFECNGFGKAAERSYLDDPDLADQCFDEYSPPPTGYRIRDAWWSDSVDADGDGYRESATLVWDPDVDDGMTGAVVSRITYIVTGTSSWMNYGQVECSEVLGEGLADSISITVTGLPHDCYHFAIYLYECGDLENEVALLHYGYDPDLNTQCFEPLGPGAGAALPPSGSAPPVRSAATPVREGRAPVNPHGGVKEAEVIREGRGSPFPGTR